MHGKVALEEHFAIEETLQDSAGFSPEADWPELKARLLDIQDRRLREMDLARHRGDAAFPERSGRAGDTRSKEGQRDIAPGE